MSPEGTGRPRKDKIRSDVVPSARVKANGVKLLKQALIAGEGSILRRVTLQEDGQGLRLPSKMPVGRPRHNWIIATALEAWKAWGLGSDEDFDYASASVIRRITEKACEN